MTIAVFNFSNDSVDIISVDAEYIRTMYSGDVERYLVEDLHYDSNDTCYMSGFKSIQFVDQDNVNQIL